MSAKEKIVMTLVALALMAIFCDEAVSMLLLTVITGAWGWELIKEGLKNG